MKVKMNNPHSLTTIVESSPIELAIAGWLHAHEKSIRTHTAYAQTLAQLSFLRYHGAFVSDKLPMIGLKRALRRFLS
jgi:hypothetical protein